MVTILEKNIKESLEKVINGILQDKTVYQEYISHQPISSTKLSVYGLSGLIHNTNIARKYGVSENEHLELLKYWQDSHDLDIIVELYNAFPNVFEGEPRAFVQYLLKQPEDITEQYGVQLW